MELFLLRRPKKSRNKHDHRAVLSFLDGQQFQSSYLPSLFTNDIFDIKTIEHFLRLKEVSIA